MQKPVGKRQLGRRYRSVDNIKMNLREIRCSDMDWIHLARDRNQWKALVAMVTYIPFKKKIWWENS
jgi:hypothetical protein